MMASSVLIGCNSATSIGVPTPTGVLPSGSLPPATAVQSVADCHPRGVSVLRTEGGRIRVEARVLPDIISTDIPDAEGQILAFVGRCFYSINVVDDGSTKVLQVGFAKSTTPSDVSAVARYIAAQRDIFTSVRRIHNVGSGVGGR